MPDLKSLSREAIPAALEKAERYRLLNEPAEAESICLDILETDPENQTGAHHAPARVDRSLQQGLRGERHAGESVAGADQGRIRARLLRRDSGRAAGQGETGAGTVRARVITPTTNCAKRCGSLRRRRKIRPPGNDDALLRWNTCARMMEKNKLAAREEDRSSSRCSSERCPGGLRAAR